MPAAIAALVLLCAACSAPDTETAESAPVAPIEVRAARVRRGEITEWLGAAGETVAANVLRLASPVAGRVTALAALPGDSLAAGQVAARVLPIENEAALHGFRVLGDTGSLDAEERRRAERLAVELRRRDIALSAPFAAVVAERLHNPEELVAANDVLLELFDAQSLYVLVQVPVGAAVTVGMPAELEIGGNPTAGGRVAALLSAVTPQAMTAQVRIALDRPLPRPLLHASAQCRIALARHESALLVPRGAVLTASAEENAAVMIAVGDHAERRAVHIGIRSGDLVEVTEGLAEGDVVLVAGQYAIPDGARVAARMAPAE